MRRLPVALVALLAFVAVAHADWSARQTDFGLTAYGETKIPPGTPAIRWNVLAVGVFCGPRGFNPGKPSVYLYGIDADRMSNGKPMQGALTVDGQDTGLTLRNIGDVMAAGISADVARSLMAARTVTVTLKDYNSPNPDVVEMTGAKPALERALRTCLK